MKFSGVFQILELATTRTEVRITGFIVANGDVMTTSSKPMSSRSNGIPKAYREIKSFISSSIGDRSLLAPPADPFDSAVGFRTPDLVVATHRITRRSGSFAMTLLGAPKQPRGKQRRAKPLDIGRRPFGPNPIVSFTLCGQFIHPVMHPIFGGCRPSSFGQQQPGSRDLLCIR
jgi:hypothetical protein